MKRSLLVTALTLALLVLLSGAALATGKPVRVFIGGPLDVPVGSCTFPVTQHILTNNEYVLIFTGDHAAIVTGSLRAISPLARRLIVSIDLSTSSGSEYEKFLPATSTNRIRLAIPLRAVRIPAHHCSTVRPSGGDL